MIIDATAQAVFGVSVLASLVAIVLLLSTFIGDTERNQKRLRFTLLIAIIGMPSFALLIFGDAETLLCEVFESSAPGTKNTVRLPNTVDLKLFRDPRAQLIGGPSGPKLNFSYGSFIGDSYGDVGQFTNVEHTWWRGQWRGCATDLKSKCSVNAFYIPTRSYRNSIGRYSSFDMTTGDFQDTDVERLPNLNGDLLILSIPMESEYAFYKCTYFN